MMAAVIARHAVALAFASALAAASPAPLDLRGYAQSDGAITVLREGTSVDPYFALQALLLARQLGLEHQADAVRWADWLVARQKPDGTFDRFCRAGPVWVGCRSADADDALLALWLEFLDGQPAELARRPAWQGSRQAAEAALARLVDPARGIYLVSAVWQHGLLMDNLEAWAATAARAALERPDQPPFAARIRQVFWDAAAGRFLVSTQPQQARLPRAFYPDAVAQVYPLVVGYADVPGGPHAWYRDWMARHRREWLAQVRTDFAWGVVAVVAWQQGDRGAAACWLGSTRGYRHSAHWTVTDEVVAQALHARGVQPAAPGACE